MKNNKERYPSPLCSGGYGKGERRGGFFKEIFHIIHTSKRYAMQMAGVNSSRTRVYLIFFILIFSSLNCFVSLYENNENWME
jgi:predicted cupin superfamily sugar epimerase